MISSLKMSKAPSFNSVLGAHWLQSPALLPRTIRTRWNDQKANVHCSLHSLFYRITASERDTALLSYTLTRIDIYINHMLYVCFEAQCRWHAKDEELHCQQNFRGWAVLKWREFKLFHSRNIQTFVFVDPASIGLVFQAKGCPRFSRDQASMHEPWAEQKYV